MSVLNCSSNFIRKNTEEDKYNLSGLRPPVLMMSNLEPVKKEDDFDDNQLLDIFKI